MKSTINNLDTECLKKRENKTEQTKSGSSAHVAIESSRIRPDMVIGTI